MEAGAIVIVEDNEPVVRLLHEALIDEPNYGAAPMREPYDFRAVAASALVFSRRGGRGGRRRRALLRGGSGTRESRSCGSPDRSVPTG